MLPSLQKTLSVIYDSAIRKSNLAFKLANFPQYSDTLYRTHNSPWRTNITCRPNTEPTPNGYNMQQTMLHYATRTSVNVFLCLLQSLHQSGANRTSSHQEQQTANGSQPICHICTILSKSKPLGWAESHMVTLSCYVTGECSSLDAALNVRSAISSGTSNLQKLRYKQ
jgi:hypothetical protein